jgi:hypothetical protein
VVGGKGRKRPSCSSCQGPRRAGSPRTLAPEPVAGAPSVQQGCGRSPHACISDFACALTRRWSSVETYASERTRRRSAHVLSTAHEMRKGRVEARRQQRKTWQLACIAPPDKRTASSGRVLTSRARSGAARRQSRRRPRRTRWQRPSPSRAGTPETSASIFSTPDARRPAAFFRAACRPAGANLGGVRVARVHSL